MKYFAVFAAFLGLVRLSHGGVDLPKVAVMPFKNSTSVHLQSTDSITDQFISILMESKRFTVLERERLGDLTEEMFAKGKFSVQGADFVFLSTLSTFDISVNRQKVALVDAYTTTAEVKVQVNVRVVDVGSSAIKFAATGTASSRNSGTTTGLDYNNPKLLDNAMVADTFRAALKDVVNNILDNLFPIKIVSVQDKQIFLNRSDLKPGQVLVAYRPGKQLVDPDTGLVLGTQDTKIGSVKVVEIFPKYCVAEAMDGAFTEAEAGAICRFPQVSLENKPAKNKPVAPKQKLNW